MAIALCSPDFPVLAAVVGFSAITALFIFSGFFTVSSFLTSVALAGVSVFAGVLGFTTVSAFGVSGFTTGLTPFAGFGGVSTLTAGVPGFIGSAVKPLLAASRAAAKVTKPTTNFFMLHTPELTLEGSRLGSACKAPAVAAHVRGKYPIASEAYTRTPLTLLSGKMKICQ